MVRRAGGAQEKELFNIESSDRFVPSWLQGVSSASTPFPFLASGGFYGRLTMAMAAPRPCGHPGCGALVRDGSGRCAKHPQVQWVKRPTPTKRVTGRRLQALRAALFAEKPLCAECERAGRVALATQRDHIAPLAEGGADDGGNVQGLCESCHDAKSQAEAQRGRRRAAG